ncbi:hypothetical protein T484DRAFT_1891032 [Baffinella frigidus]|nr:hypothetical protein T484DRAFT_1891032 [Cryptophyta sp. CCMP2293]
MAQAAAAAAGRPYVVIQHLQDAGFPECDYGTCLEGTMEGWYQPTRLSGGAIAAHWITFLSMFSCTLFLGYSSWTAKGPSSKQRYFAGYNEEYNISFYVNLFASISYFGKCLADVQGHNYAEVGPYIIGLGNYAYADYMFTCPMLVFDLLTQLRAPYRLTAGVLIYSVLLTGSAANFYPGERWVLSGRTGMNLLSEDAVQILHCIFDLIAKSVFGFALARFRSYYDKKMYEMVDALHLGEDVDIEDALEKGIHGKNLFENQLQMRASNSHNRGDVGVCLPPL